ncbi:MULTISPECIES: hypothetical protein [Corallococcus]|uniref:hypothetical protein n=1 Tax=Corallococcus TaxID=83461 RepID=UPI00117F87AF|nr:MULTISPECIES: hypothetical protein [Corallococcus]NBD08664.1 hypothetical protein [Corallococcus silvisoli]TSC32634.1 hypothetical protein FOF48_06380 [Corallococcus sp. Z5C101001]
MNHMPYESMIVGGSEPGPGRQAPAHEDVLEEPGRTPETAEDGGLEEEPHRMADGDEPGRTPGSAEGEDSDAPTRF